MYVRTQTGQSKKLKYARKLKNERAEINYSN